MQDTKLVFTFEGVTTKEANLLARRFADRCSTFDDVSAKITKDDPNTLDMGTTVILILGTPVVIALAGGVADGIRTISQGIADWLKKENATIIIQVESATGDRTILGSGLKGNDAARIAEALSEATKGTADE